MFHKVQCRQYETGECTRSGFCNFMHLKPISRKLRSELYGRNSRRGEVLILSRQLFIEILLRSGPRPQWSRRPQGRDRARESQEEGSEP